MFDDMLNNALNEINQKIQKEELIKYAVILHDLYESFKSAGFTTQQSFDLVKQFMICSAMRQNSGKKN